MIRIWTVPPGQVCRVAVDMGEVREIGREEVRDLVDFRQTHVEVRWRRDQAGQRVAVEVVHGEAPLVWWNPQGGER